MMKDKEVADFAVYLNVYDLTAINGYAYWCGLGAYHSGVEVHDVEYGFGGTDKSTTGISKVKAKKFPGYTFRKSILIGRTDMDPKEVRAFMDNLAEQYSGNSYNIITKNCNHFCNDVCQRLFGKPIPRWVNRLARLGLLFSCFLPALLNETRKDDVPKKKEAKKTIKITTRHVIEPSRSDPELNKDITTKYVDQAELRH